MEDKRQHICAMFDIRDMSPPLHMPIVVQQRPRLADIIEAATR